MADIIYKDFDRIIDNDIHYLCKDDWGRKLLDDYKLVVDKKFEDLKNRYVMIGDSYMEGYTPDGNIESFAPKLKRLLKASDEDFIIACHGGVGFKNVDASGKTYLTLIDEAYAMTTKPETITHVIFAGGFNDQIYNVNDIQVKIIEAYNKVKKKFPKATMYLANVASIFNSNQADVLYNLQDHVQLAYTKSAQQGHSIVDMGYIGRYLHERSMLSAKDGIHPVDYGQNVIASAMYYKLMGGDYFPVGPSREYVCGYKDQYGHDSNVTLLENISGDTLTVSIRNIYFFNTANITAGTSTYFVGRITDSNYIRGGYDTVFAVNAVGTLEYIEGGSKFESVPMTIGVSPTGNFFIKLKGLTPDGTTFRTYNNVRSIVFDNCFIRMPLGYS